MSFQGGTHAYICVRPDGIAVGLVFDDPGYEKDTAKTVMEWVRDGRSVLRLENEKACARLHEDHPKWCALRRQGSGDGTGDVSQRRERG